MALMLAGVKSCLHLGLSQKPCWTTGLHLPPYQRQSPQLGPKALSLRVLFLLPVALSSQSGFLPRPPSSHQEFPAALLRLPASQPCFTAHPSQREPSEICPYSPTHPVLELVLRLPPWTMACGAPVYPILQRMPQKPGHCLFLKSWDCPSATTATTLTHTLSSPPDSWSSRPFSVKEVDRLRALPAQELCESKVSLHRLRSRPSPRASPKAAEHRRARLWTCHPP